LANTLFSAESAVFTLWGSKASDVLPEETRGGCHREKSDGTCFHTHMVAASTWGYVVLVEDFSLPTPKQQLKPIATPKSNAILSHSCGVP
jgi:hypothetical protein